MIKKILALVILIVFMVSIVPMALAESGSDKDESEVKIDDDESEIRVKDGDSEVRIKEKDGETEIRVRDRSDKAKEVRERIKERVKNGKERVHEVRAEVREKQESGTKIVAKARNKVKLTKEKIKISREKYLRVREKYREAKDILKEHRSELSELKGKAKCQDDTQDCRGKKSALKRGVKQHLLKTSDLIESSLQRLINRIEDSKMDEQDKQDAIAKLTELEGQLTSEKEKVQEMADDATSEELRASIKGLKETWKEVRKTQKRIIASLVNSKLDNLVEKHQEFINGMELRVSTLKQEGADVSELESLLDDFKDAVETLEDNHARARVAWKDAHGSQEKLEAWKNAQLQVRDDMKKTKSILRKFLEEYRELKKGVSDESDGESEDDSNDSEDDSEGTTAEE